MRPTSQSRPSWVTGVVLLLSVLQQVLAYRPVQHCKTLGDNGHYSACMAITQYYNATTGHSDMYVRYHWFRYRKSKNGWHSFALGQMMDGALMVMMYGDPNTPSLPMTVDVRTSDGHSAPMPIADLSRLAGYTSEVEVKTAIFREYEGDIKIQSLNEKPTHVGIAEVIIRDYEGWTGFKLRNTSEAMNMLWASNYKQNMDDDFSHGRRLDMHQFGLGFGFVYVDMLHAVTPEPMFGPIDELGGMTGAAEARTPDPPTEKELAAGEAYIAEQRAASSGATASPVSTASATRTAAASSPTATEQADNTSTADQPVEQPVRTILGKTLRDWMWHLHGLIMSLAFLAIYPFGTYLIRSGSKTAFKQHWTVQALGTVAMVVGSGIGYVNSYSISVKHQYVGIFLLFSVVVQGILGWRHHMQFINEKRKGWLSKAHIIVGRIFLPLGFVNIILGMLLRQYGWFTLALVIVTIGLESAALGYFLLYAVKKRAATQIRMNETGPPTGDEAEEYFQLAGEDEFSDSDGEHEEARSAKDQERREQAERLRRLDKV